MTWSHHPDGSGLTSHRVFHHDEGSNEEGMCLQRIVHYQDLMAKHYNTKVKSRHFQIGDLVLRKVTMATRDPSQGKLGPNWERDLLIGNLRWAEALSPMEHRALKEVLLVVVGCSLFYHFLFVFPFLYQKLNVKRCQDSKDVEFLFRSFYY